LINDAKKEGNTFSTIQKTKTDLTFGYGASLKETVSYKKLFNAKIIKK